MAVNQKAVKVLNKVLEAGFTDEKAIAAMTMDDILSMQGITVGDITLINDKISELPHLLFLSKRMMTTIKCNLTFSMTLNFIAIVLAITGILNPIIGALVHNAGSVLVIVNSAFLLNWRKRKVLLKL